MPSKANNGMARLFFVTSILWTIAATALCVIFINDVSRHPCRSMSVNFVHWVDANGKLIDLCSAKSNRTEKIAPEDFFIQKRMEQILRSNSQPIIQYFPTTLLLLSFISLPLFLLFIVFKTIRWVMYGFRNN